MDMYQKRKMRAEKKSKEDESKKFSSVNINWVILFYGNTNKNIEISSFL